MSIVVYDPGHAIPADIGYQRHPNIASFVGVTKGYYGITGIIVSAGERLTD
jgi:hypothetical protein